MTPDQVSTDRDVQMQSGATLLLIGANLLAFAVGAAFGWAWGLGLIGAFYALVGLSKRSQANG